MNKNLFRLGLFISLFCIGIVPVLAATYTVNSLNDVDDATCDGVHCSLKEAVNAANSNPGADNIVFSISGTITQGVQPQITEQVDIDGNGAGIVLSKGLAINSGASNVTIRGLTLTNAGESALYVDGSNSMIGGPDITDRNIFIDNASNQGSAMGITGTGNTIQNNYINVEANGTTVDTSRDGIMVMAGSSGTIIKDNVITSGGGCAINFFAPSGTIGATTIKGNSIGAGADGTTDLDPFVGICDRSDGTINGLLTIGGSGADRNIISGSVTQGISLTGNFTAGVLIKNNYIGTSAAGTSAVNNNEGIYLNGSFSGGTYQIGGTIGSDGNVVSGNNGTGIKIFNASNWTVKGNIIGLNAAGDGDLGNSNSGIWIGGNSTNVTIGDKNDYNVISGNSQQGIHVQDATGILSFPGNRIGTNSAGTAAIQNDQSGIWFQGSTFTATVGDALSSSPTSVISGNVDRGIRVEGGTVSIYSSIIGLNVTQTAAIPNGSGITGNATIGNTRTQGANIIAGNNGSGIWGGGTIKGNFIGVNSSETGVFANNGYGILIENGSATIGGTNEGEGNVIGGHNNYQIYLDTNSMGIPLTGNYLGLFTNGSVISGTSKGLYIKGSNINVGGENFGRNYIGGVNENGITINSAAAESNIEILNNYIGVAPDGTTDRGVTLHGIDIQQGKNIYIGVTKLGNTHGGNVISGNGGKGVFVSASIGTVDTVYIESNKIGVNAAGDTKVANDGTGIKVDTGVLNLVVGGGDSDSRNVISGNGEKGLVLFNVNGAVVQGNYIGTNALGATNIGNTSHGLVINGDSDSNVIGFAFSDATLDDSKRNIINYNGGYGLYLGQSGSVLNTIRGNILGPNNGTGDIYFDQNPNNAISLSGTTLTTLDTSKVAGTTNLADGTKVDIYNVDDAATGNVIVYEGSAVVSGGAFELNKDFDAVAGDSYAVQFTEADGDSSIYKGGAVVADSTLPNQPGGLMSQTVSNASYTFSGTKDAWTKIERVLDGPVFTDIVDYSSSTNWTYDVTLNEGVNSFGFTAKDFSDNRSLQRDVVINLDTTAPSTPTITSATTASGSGATSSFSITGTKDAETSIYLNGVLVVVADQSTTWSYSTTLSVGVNSVGPFTSKDNILNESSGVTATITYSQNVVEEPEEETPPVVISYGGGGGSGGSGGPTTASSNQSSNQVVSEPETNVVMPVDTTTGLTVDEIVKEVESTYPVYVPDSQVSVEETAADTSIVRDVIEGVKEVVEVVGDKAENLFNAAPEEPVTPLFTPVQFDLPENKVAAVVTRQALLSERAYEEVSADEDHDGIPDSLEQIYFGSLDILDPNADTDGDGLTDGVELMMGTNLLSADSDSDGLSDSIEMEAGTSGVLIDSDADGLTDAEEIELGLNAGNADSDADGFSDYIEMRYGTGISGVLDPLVGLKDDDGDGAIDAWEKEFGLENVDYEALLYIAEVDASLKMPLKMRDTDGDGVSDWIEMNRGTNPNSPDTDRDGLSDSDEIYVYFTDPLKDSREQGQIYKPRISTVRQNTAFTGNKATLVGVGQPNTKLTVLFLPRSWVTSKPALLSIGQYLMANLFSDSLEQGIYEEDVYTDSSGKFLVQKDLPTGKFDVMVRSYNLDGSLADETLPYEIEVKEELASGLVSPYRLDKKMIDLNSLQVLMIENSRPILYGKATKGYTLEGMWASELFTSSLVMDTDSKEGEFVMMAPNDLEDGLHKVVLQGVDSLSNLYTAAINVDFRVTGGIVEIAEKDTNARMKIIGVGLGSILIVTILWFLARGHRERYQD